MKLADLVTSGRKLDSVTPEELLSLHEDARTGRLHGELIKVAIEREIVRRIAAAGDSSAVLTQIEASAKEAREAKPVPPAPIKQ